jgi:hypothetical protein
MTTSTVRTPILLVAILVIAAGILSACAMGDDTQPGATGAGVAAAAPSNAAQPSASTARVSRDENTPSGRRHAVCLPAVITGTMGLNDRFSRRRVHGQARPLPSADTRRLSNVAEANAERSTR